MPNKGKRCTEEQKRKISETKKEYFKTHTGFTKGKHHTEETKQKLSKISKEYNRTHIPYWKDKTFSKELEKDFQDYIAWETYYKPKKFKASP